MKEFNKKIDKLLIGFGEYKIKNDKQLEKVNERLSDMENLLKDMNKNIG